MHLRRVVLSALLIASVMGGMFVLPASAASPPNSAATIFQQGFNLSMLESQLNQQGLNLSALTNLLQQFGVGSVQIPSNASTIFGGGYNGALSNTLLAKAQPDACFSATYTMQQNGRNRLTSVTDTYPNGPNPTCPAGEQPKTDQAYVWGLTQSGNDLWFGTAANTQCLVEGSYLQSGRPSANSAATCEYGLSPLVSGPPYLDASLGDWRAPHVYFYNLVTKQLTDAGATNSSLTNDLQNTLGLRSAGTVGNYVLLAGPALHGGVVNVYVFTASDHAYQGMIALTRYDNIRKWLTYNGVLYTAMHNTAQTGGGDVVRWNVGDMDPNTAFTVVGHVNGDPAELAIYNSRMFISTWPDPTALANLTSGQGLSLSSLTNLPVAGLWMSPAFSGSLAASTATWQEPWNVLDYEPDPVTALTYGGGAIMSYGGFLFWGTMHVPLLSTEAHLGLYENTQAPDPNGILPNPKDQQETLTLEQKSERAIAIFRGANFGQGRPVVQLLYGETTLPTWVPNSLTNIQGPGRWINLPTKSGFPLFGHSGFGNPYNNYTWTMATYKGALYVGTMDWSMLAGSPPGSNPGADLWRFVSPYTPAGAVDQTGVGNPYNYGIRTMITATNGGALYLGMANPMNLALDANGNNLGGWELRQLK